MKNVWKKGGVKANVTCKMQTTIFRKGGAPPSPLMAKGGGWLEPSTALDTGKGRRAHRRMCNNHLQTYQIVDVTASQLQKPRDLAALYTAMDRAKKIDFVFAPEIDFWPQNRGEKIVFLTASTSPRLNFSAVKCEVKWLWTHTFRWLILTSFHRTSQSVRLSSLHSPAKKTTIMHGGKKGNKGQREKKCTNGGRRKGGMRPVGMFLLTIAGFVCVGLVRPTKNKVINCATKIQWKECSLLCKEI